MDLFASFTLFASMLVAVSEFIFGKLFPLKGKPAQYATWGLGTVLGILGDYFKFGLFADLTSPGFLDLFYVEGALIGFLAALTANGLFSVDKVRMVLTAFGIRSTRI